jgi:preprotein translocase subunit YajC
MNPFIRDAASGERWSMLHALIVLAQQEGQQPNPGQNSFLLILPVLFVLFYLLILRPQKRMEQERQALASNLKKNDEVLTSAGIYGTVTDVSETDDKITVKVADNVRVKMTKGSVVRNLTNEEAAKQAKAAKEAKA